MQDPLPQPASPAAPAEALPAQEFFLRDLLAAQCRTAPADSGAFFRVRPGLPPELVALHPAPRRNQSSPAWLAQALRAIADNPAAPEATIHPLDLDESIAAAPSASLILFPLGTPPEAPMHSAYIVRAPTHALGSIIERLELSCRLVETFILRDELSARETRLASLERTMQVLAAGAEHNRFVPATIALCNTVASQWRAARVSLGLIRGRGGRDAALAAMSHTERLVRKTPLAQSIESAMEECADQDIEVRYPTTPEEPIIARAHAELARAEGARAILSLPLRNADRVIGVLTLERDKDDPFTEPEIESLRLLCELITPRIALLDRFSRRLPVHLAEDALASIVGPRQTWAKLAAVLTLGTILFMTFVPGAYRVSSTFRIEAAAKRIIPAPFDAYIRDVHVTIGDEVAAGDTLARLDDAELRLRLAAVQAEIAASEREVAIAQRDRKEAETQMARAKGDESRARAALIEHQIAQAVLIAPESGLVLSGDLMRLRGAPVTTGDVLFEVAPLDALRADAYVPEDRIADIKPGQRGELATASFPGTRIGFDVEGIDPAAEVRQGDNVFRVRLRLHEVPAWLRPGMEGEARIDIDRRPYGRIWFKRLADWLRMKLWI